MTRPASTLMLMLSMVAAATACLVDPVHSSSVDALGGEEPGVPKGPRHRPGQPCLVCHGGSGPGAATFSVAGTIYRSYDVKTAVGGVRVSITDATGEARAYVTNDAGNFYVDVATWQPAYPLTVSLLYGAVKTDMNTRIAREGSCGSCHGDPQGPASAGHIFLVANDADFPPP